METVRGTIYNRDRACQKMDYTGLRFGNITPTDIDGLIDYHGRAWIILEYKVRGIEMPLGQKVALERLTDTLGRQRPAIAIIAEHDTRHEVKT